MKILLVARKNLLEVIREPQLLGLALLLPLVFVGITAATYQYPLVTTYTLFYLDPDRQGTHLLEALESQRSANGQPVFHLVPTSNRESAQEAIKNEDATILLIIKGKDGGGAGDKNEIEKLELTVVGDALSARFYRASTLLDSALNRYSDSVSGRPQVVQTTEQALVAAGPVSEFDLYAPGMIMMALLLIIPQTAMLVAREIRWKTLQRLSITQLTTFEFLGGISLAQMAVAVLQVVLVLLAAVAMGFNNQGSIWLALVVGLAVSFSAVGLGLIVACFSENDSQAANIGSTLTMLQVFLSGSFYQMPPTTLFTLAGHQIDLFDVFPATHGFSALQQVLTFGAGWNQIAFRLAATALLSAVYFALGVVIFQKLQMRRAH